MTKIIFVEITFVFTAHFPNKIFYESKSHKLNATFICECLFPPAK